MKILCIEDNASNMHVVQRLAAALGYELLAATHGQEGLALVGQTPDIILMDISLPDMDGLTLTHQIRAMLPDTPIIAVTAHALPDDRQKCLAAGCTDYLSKPYRILELVALLQKYARNWETMSS